MYKLDLDSMPTGDPSAEALRDRFGSKTFTKNQVVDHIADLANDRGYANWEFGQLEDAGYIVEA